VRRARLAGTRGRGLAGVEGTSADAAVTEVAWAPRLGTREGGGVTGEGGSALGTVTGWAVPWGQ